mmetsp:Transcript_25945/g.58804  ORF Transcript_25945/g.58804 Transcript_25945/m.58804 type:complete len:257 (+) Transcript_25945:80-850(+)
MQGLRGALGEPLDVGLSKLVVQAKDLHILASEHHVECRREHGGIRRIEEYDMRASGRLCPSRCKLRILLKCGRHRPLEVKSTAVDGPLGRRGRQTGPSGPKVEEEAHLGMPRVQHLASCGGILQPEGLDDRLQPIALCRLDEPIIKVDELLQGEFLAQLHLIPGFYALLLDIGLIATGQQHARCLLDPAADSSLCSFLCHLQGRQEARRVCVGHTVHGQGADSLVLVVLQRLASLGLGVACGLNCGCNPAEWWAVR